MASQPAVEPRLLKDRFEGLFVAIELNHTIVPARDKVAAAKFFARILGLPFGESAVGPFAPVRVNGSLTMDFADSNRREIHHYAFKVSEEDFDAIFRPAPSAASA